MRQKHHSDSEYEAYEEWLSNNISDDDFEKAISPYRQEDGSLDQLGLISGLRDAFNTLMEKEQRRLGDRAFMANSIGVYVDKGILEGKTDITSPLRERVIDNVNGVKLEALAKGSFERQSQLNVQRQRQALIDDILNSSSSVSEAREQLAGVTLNQEEAEKVEKQLETMQRRENAELERVRETTERTITDDYLRRIYTANQPSQLNTAFQREIERTFKEPETRLRVLRAYFDKKLELAPYLVQTQTREKAERLRELPEGIGGTTRRRLLEENAEKALIRKVEDVYGRFLESPVSVRGRAEPISEPEELAKTLTIKSMTALGLSNEEARLLRKKYKAELRGETQRPSRQPQEEEEEPEGEEQLL